MLRAKLSEKEKFNLLRATSVTIARIRAYGKARSSKEELKASILSFYLERIVLDLKYNEKGIAANLSYDIMKKRCYGVVKEITKRKRMFRSFEEQLARIGHVGVNLVSCEGKQ